MKITKNLSLTLTACALGIGSSSAQFTSFDFRATSFGNYRQTVLPGSGETTFFEGGNFGVSLRDGQALFSPPGCFDDEFFNPFLGCPLGATGLVTFGDLDGDGVVDPGIYFSISNISRAAIIQPFAQAAARLVSAPPSLLPRPLAGFTDNSAIVFFNVRTAAVQQFNITGMNLGRAFTAAERGRFDGETVPGTYIFNFTQLINPFLNQTPPPVALALNIFPTLDGFRRVNNSPQGFRFRNVTYQDGFAVLDPLELNTIEWEGNTVNFIAPGADSLFLSIKPLANPADPLSAVVEFDGQGQFIDDPNDTVNDPPDQIINPTFPLFPTFAGPTTTRIILPNPLVQSFIVPPNFLFSGQTGILDLEFVVNRPTSSVISDRSTRRFRLPVIVVTQFTTAIAAMLPPTASSLQRSADFDFDGDGASNFAEWAFGSDPNNASSSPSSASLTLTSTPQSGTSATPAVANATESTPTSTTTTTTSSGTTSSSAAASSSANAADGTTTANTSATPSASSAAGSSTGTSTSASTSGNSLQYTVRKLVNPVPALRYTVEYSTDMQSWQTVTSSDPRFVVTETASNLTVATVGAPTGGGGFFRSRVAPR